MESDVTHIVSDAFVHRDQERILAVLSRMSPTDVGSASIPQFFGELHVPLLYIAAWRGWTRVWQYLIHTYSSNSECRDFHGRSSLHYAAVCGERDAVERLAKSLCYSGNDDDKQTPLWFACCCGHVEVAELLVCFQEEGTLAKQMPLGCVIDKEEKKRNLLHYACMNGHVELVKFLISRLSFDPLATDCDGTTPLLVACGKGELAVVQCLIKEFECDPLAAVENGFGPLHKACQSGKLDLVKYLIIECGCDPHSSDEDGSTPLHIACVEGSLDVVKFLITECDCNAFCRDSEGRTIFHDACSSGNLDLVKYMLHNVKSDPHAKDKCGCTPLHEACSSGKLIMVQFLIEEVSSDPYATDDSRRTPLHNACVSGNLNVVKFLVQKFEFDLSAKDISGCTPLHKACESGNLNLVRFLISQSCSVSDTNNDGASCLHLACSSGNLELVKCLISEFGCDPFARTESGCGILSDACCSSNLDLVKYLIRICGCDPLSSDDDGSTLLHEACFQGSLDIVKFLMTECNCNVSCRDSDGVTIFHDACSSGNLDLVKYLVLNVKSDPNAKDDSGCTPLHNACSSGNLDVVRFLVEETKSDPNAKDNSGCTPLHNACLSGNVAMVNFLVQMYDSDVHTRDKNGHTPLHKACQSGKLDLVKFLLEEVESHPDTHDALLIKACGSGQLDIVKFVIERFRLGLAEGSSWTPLHSACVSGNMDIVKFLVEEHKSDPYTKDVNGCTLLHIACFQGHLEMVKYLVHQCKCDPECKDIHGFTPLHYASLCGKTNIFNLYQNQFPHEIQLLQHEEYLQVIKCLVSDLHCDTLVKSGEWLTILHCAFASGRIDVIKYVVKHTTCSLNARDSHGYYPFHLACYNGSLDVIKVLVSELHCNAICYDECCLTPLHIACKIGNLGIVDYLLREVKCHLDHTLLYVSCLNGQIGITQYLLGLRGVCIQNGRILVPIYSVTDGGTCETLEQVIFDPNFPYGTGRTLLHAACKSGNLQLVQYLMQKFDFDVHDRDRLGISAVHLAVKSGCLDLVQYLVEDWCCSASQNAIIYPSLSYMEEGMSTIEERTFFVIKDDKSLLWFDIVQRDGIKCTPLHLACELGHLDIVEYLTCKVGTDPSVERGDGSMPLHIASSHGHVEIVKLLVKKYGCKADCKDRRGLTALYYACKNGHVKVVEFLISDCNCDPFDTYYYNITPFQQALWYRSNEVVEFIMNYAKEGVTYSDADIKLMYKNYSPLDCAITIGNKELLTHLVLTLKCDPTVRNTRGVSSLDLVCQLGQIETVKLFLQTLKQTKLHEICSLSGSPSLVHCACSSGSISLVKYLVEEEKLDTKQQDTNGLTPLHIASEKGLLHIVQYLVSNGHCSITCLNREGCSPLHVACKAGSIAVVKYLVELNHSLALDGDAIHSFLVTADYKGHTPLHKACIEGSLEVVQYLVEERYCNPLEGNIKKRSAMALAISSNASSVMRYLVDKTLAKKSVNNETLQPLISAAIKHNNLEALECMLPHLSQDQFQFAVSNIFCDRRCEETIAIYIVDQLSTTCSSFRIGKSGKSLLHFAAAANEWVDVCCRLIRRYKCDPSVKDKNGFTPLHDATRAKNGKIVQLLLAHGSVDRENNDGHSSLGLAVRHHFNQVIGPFCKHYLHRCIESTDMLVNAHLLLFALEYHSNIQPYLLNFLDATVTFQPFWVKDRKNMNVVLIHLATNQGWLKACKMLKNKHGADLTVLDGNGDTPVHYAAAADHVNVIRYLVMENNCSCNIQDNDGRVPLHLAIIYGCLNAVRFLVDECKCDVMCVDKLGGNTPLHYAVLSGNVGVVRFLLRTGKVDPMFQNAYNETPQMLKMYDFEILKEFSHFSQCRVDFPVESFCKVVLCGNSAAGKSSLAAVLKERCHDVKEGKVSNVKPFTAGIVPIELVSPELGNMVLFDLAGHHEYHSTHCALLSTFLQPSSAVFLIFIDVSKSDDDLDQEFYYWVNFVKNVNNRNRGNFQVIIIGSHADKQESLITMISKKLKRRARQNFEEHAFLGFVPMDCRQLVSADLDELITLLKTGSSNILAKTEEVSFYCHMLFAFMRTKLTSTIITVSELLKKIPIEYQLDDKTIANLSMIGKKDVNDVHSEVPLPLNVSDMVSLLKTLNDKGLLMFLMNDKELQSSWIVVKISELLSTVHGTLFAPEEFVEYKHIASNTGLVPISSLKELFPSINTELLVHVLTTLDICRCIDSDILQIVHVDFPKEVDSSSVGDVLFFPALVNAELHGPDDSVPSFHCQELAVANGSGWSIYVSDPNSSFTPHLLQNVMLKLAYKCCKCEPPVGIVQSKEVHRLRRRCTVWKSGLSWTNDDVIKVVVEFSEQLRCLSLLVSDSEKRESAMLRSALISTILSIISDICSAVEFSEYLIAPSDVGKAHHCMLSELQVFAMGDIANAILEQKDAVPPISDTHAYSSSLKTKTLLSEWEPYLALPNEFIKVLIHCSTCEEDVCSDYDAIKKCFPNLPAHFDANKSTIKDVKDALDRFSVFAGRNIWKLAGREEPSHNDICKILQNLFPSKNVKCDLLTDPPTLLDFLENVATRIPAKWKKFGYALSVPSGVLDGFDQQYHGDQVECYAAIFKVLENQTEPLRWERLLKVLRTSLMAEALLAEELSQRISTAKQ